ncbi:hypothetical protein BCAR13_270031 [Paraburkholderia caribensis]|nr:hypothetical protein BCAR13_270031 [Paraburkholderia caribensis]
MRVSKGTQAKVADGPTIGMASGRPLPAQDRPFERLQARASEWQELAALRQCRQQFARRKPAIERG